MKKIYLSLIAASFLFGPSVSATELAQKQQEVKTTQSSKFETGLKQVEGTIINHKFVNVFKNKQEMQSAEKSGKAEKKMLVVMLKTDKGNERLVVDLGQVQDVSKIKDGETKLQVEGKMINLGNKQLFVAKRAKLDGSLIDIQRKKS